MSRVAVKPELFRWARERARMDTPALVERFPKYEEWESGDSSPTLKQLEKLSQATLTPFGYFFLPEPPQEELPIPDFRTIASTQPQRPSARLLTTIYTCQRRQDWYRDYVIASGEDPLSFIGTSRQSDGVEEISKSIRDIVNLSPEHRASASDAETALRLMFQEVEEAGILVMRNGVVGNNTSQPLLVEEFRGFALSDPYAPLIFINASDTKAAQMFTLAHELTHLWLGQSGVSNFVETQDESAMPLEAFCNRVAAETLVPIENFRVAWRRGAAPQTEFKRLAKQFRVSTLVIIRRAFDAGFLSAEEFHRLYRTEAEDLAKFARSGGGDFYKTQTSRLGRRFPVALITSTLEGRTLYTEAFRLLGFSKTETFEQLAKELKFST